MKTIFTIFLGITTAFTIINCSSDNNRDEIIQEAQDFTNSNYIKKQMVGKWKFTAHESSPGLWVTTTYDSYFQFDENNTYTYKSVFDTNILPLQKGNYSITAVNGNNNAFLTLSYQENNKAYTRKIILKSLENNVVTIFESDWNERYTKQ